MKIKTLLTSLLALAGAHTLAAYTVDFSDYAINDTLSSNTNFPDASTGPLRYNANAPVGATATATVVSNGLSPNGKALRLSTTGTNGQPYSYIKDTQATTFAAENLYREVTFNIPSGGNGSIYIALVSGASSSSDGHFSLNTFQEVGGSLAANPAMIMGFLIANNNAINARRLVGDGASGNQQSYNPNTNEWQNDGVSFTSALNAETAYTARFVYEPSDQSIAFSVINASTSTVLATGSTPLSGLNTGIDTSSFRLVVGDVFNNSTYDRHIDVHSVSSIPEPAESAAIFGMLLLALALFRRRLIASRQRDVA